MELRERKQPSDTQYEHLAYLRSHGEFRLKMEPTTRLKKHMHEAQSVPKTLSEEHSSINPKGNSIQPGVSVRMNNSPLSSLSGFVSKAHAGELSESSWYHFQSGTGSSPETNPKEQQYRQTAAVRALQSWMRGPSFLPSLPHGRRRMAASVHLGLETGDSWYREMFHL